jgi:hypothetical protein
VTGEFWGVFGNLVALARRLSDGLYSETWNEAIRMKCEGELSVEIQLTSEARRPGYGISPVAVFVVVGRGSFSISSDFSKGRSLVALFPTRRSTKNTILDSRITNC